MNFFVQFFNSFLYQPLLNALLVIYHYLTWRDLGLAVIVLTVIIRVILHPLSRKSLRSQKEMQLMQPKIKALQEKFKTDKNAQGRALMELYQREKVNPFSGCLPLLLQLPILIALYQVFLNILNPAALQSALYFFVPNPGAIKPTLFYLINLDNVYVLAVIAVAAGVAQFIQTKAFLPANNADAPGSTNNVSAEQAGQTMQRQMAYILPIITVLMIWQFKALIGVYWFFSTLVGIFEQQMITKKFKDKNKE